MDNGSELTSRHFLVWGIDQRIELAHIQPGKPVQNAYIESFNGRFRDECLNTKLVPEPVGSTPQDRSVADRIQPGTAAQQSRITARPMSSLRRVLPIKS